MSYLLESAIGEDRRAACEANDAAMRTFTRAARPHFVTTPAGITIGIAHIAPPPRVVSLDAEHIQAALLEPRTARPLSMLERVFGAIWRNL